MSVFQNGINGINNIDECFSKFINVQIWSTDLVSNDGQGGVQYSCFKVSETLLLDDVFPMLKHPCHFIIPFLRTSHEYRVVPISVPIADLLPFCLSFSLT